LEKIKAETIDYLQHFDNIQYVVDMKKVSESSVPQVIKEKIINGYNYEFSGEVQIVLKSGWYSDDNLRGATHGTWNPYDTHIPLLFMGWGIQHGISNTEVYMTDIAPTIAALLKIQMPSGCIGKPIADVLKKAGNRVKKNALPCCIKE
jgi:arylsulfatase A-like enzyme